MKFLQDFKFVQDDMINQDKYLDIIKKNKDNLCYIKTDYFILNRKFIWRNKLHPDDNDTRQNVLVGHSDYAIDNKVIEKHKFKTWFVVNNFTTNLPNVYSLPMGIQNSSLDTPIHHIIGRTDLFFKVNQKEKELKNLVYMNINISTYPVERQYVYNKFCKYDWVTIGKMAITVDSLMKFFEDIYNHKFCLCPRGNGLDTHRLWESLYLKTIPIVIYHDNYKDMTDLPILFINSWDEITKEFLEQKYIEMCNKEYNMDKLKISWWENFINSKI